MRIIELQAVPRSMSTALGRCLNESRATSVFIHGAAALLTVGHTGGGAVWSAERSYRSGSRWRTLTPLLAATRSCSSRPRRFAPLGAAVPGGGGGEVVGSRWQ